MSRELKRQAAYGAALAGLLASFALLRDVPAAGALFALAAGGVVAAYALRSDEVERSLALAAAAAAFALVLALAITLRAAGQDDVIAAAARELWAVMIGAFLVCWLALRIRLG